MNYKDQWATDEDGNQFVFTVEMQRALEQAGLPIEPSSLAELDMSPSTPAPRPQRESAPEKQSEPETSGEEYPMPDTIQIDPMSGKYIGRMKWYNNQKGYGFIMRGGGEEIFFHKSNTAEDISNIQEGQWILYDVEETRKGPEATDVEPYEGDTSLLA
ncbi:MAG: cold shock domain-containing protein [Ardenticatenaceae bacterium]|nr:cold shock domain-containing protein [Anaerolineales bacterium]MCB8941916.1 cold shock domain-containing protein [Ardenticatenaceae bacterium]MCB8973030.1 cold shock domain-containing protein [Ardenticatenaceae bacterium]